VTVIVIEVRSGTRVVFRGVKGTVAAACPRHGVKRIVGVVGSSVGDPSDREQLTLLATRVCEIRTPDHPYRPISDGDELPRAVRAAMNERDD